MAFNPIATRARIWPCVLFTLILLICAGARAQDRNAPVTFTADDVQYDRDAGIVTATGHVEAWQNGRTLRADKVTFNRNTDIAAATGHVVLIEPDGQVVFSDYAELTKDMKSGVMSGMRTLLDQNGRLVANGARRTDAKLNELTRAVYSTCNLCAQDPTRAPLWDIRAREAVQDLETRRIEYRDAIVDIYGIPVMYLPFLTHPDPTAKRASGLLTPSIGAGSKYLGAFVQVPYYFVIDDQSDLTATLMQTTRAGESLSLLHRQRFNEGKINTQASLASDNGTFQGHVFSHGDFALTDVWRWGFDINRASSENYVRDFRIAENTPVLTSQVFLEGYGQGSYARTDMRVYQSLTTATAASRLPTVLPRFQYSFVGQPDAWGGRLSLSTGAFNVVRGTGTSTERASLQLGWQRPFVGPVGDLWTVSLNVDSAAYAAQGLQLIPNYAIINRANSDQAMPTAAVEFRWPLARDGGSWGQQVLEPIIKLMASPRSPSYASGRIPNEDSLDAEFTDATLFSRNRYPGIDRLEGDLRAAVGLHAAWHFPGGQQIDTMFGQSFRDHPDTLFTAASGLRGTTSDYVGRISVTPMAGVDVTTRERFDRVTGRVKFADSSASFGTGDFGIGAGYIYSTTNPYASYDTAPSSAANIAATNIPRHEVSLNGRARIDENWKLRGNVVRDLRRGVVSSYAAGANYEDECLIFDVALYRRYTSINGDHGDSGILFNVTLKSVGEFGFHAN